MAADEWQKGFLRMSVTTLSPDKLRSDYLSDNAHWHDGYVAFSTIELRLKEVGLPKFREWLEGWSDGTTGRPEGFLMEAGLWRSDNDGFEEVAVEREGDLFQVRSWRITIKNRNGAIDCYYRPARTFVRSNLKVFTGLLPSMEVVAPEHRLHIFVTIGGDAA